MEAQEPPPNQMALGGVESVGVSEVRSPLLWDFIMAGAAGRRDCLGLSSLYQKYMEMQEADDRATRVELEVRDNMGG